MDPIKRVPYIERKDGILQPLEIKHIVAEGFLRVISEWKAQPISETDEFIPSADVQTTVPPSRPRSVFMFPGLRGI